MNKFIEVYTENKKLDDLFHKLYNNFHEKTIEKNIVELLVEIGELANETRCFKYWSNKKPSEKDVILEEYADCFIMALCFCNMKNIDLNEPFVEIKISDVVAQFKELFIVSSKLDISLDGETIKLILSNLLNLGRLLDFSDKDIIESCIKKINKNKERFKTGF